MENRSNDTNNEFWVWLFTLAVCLVILALWMETERSRALRFEAMENLGWGDEQSDKRDDDWRRRL